MGGAQILLAQQLHGDEHATSSGDLVDSAATPLFDAMVVAEPIIAPLASPSPPGGWVHSPLARLALRRKARFESMAAARSRLFSKPPLSMWDPLSQEGYLARGLLECGLEDETARSSVDGHGGSTGPALKPGGASAASAVPSHECEWEEGGHNASALYGMLEQQGSAWFSKSGDDQSEGEGVARWGSRGE